MFTIPTAPNLADEIADQIRRSRKQRDSGNNFVNYRGNTSEEAGRFTTAGDALVVVEALVTYSTGYIYNPPNSHDEHRVQVSAVAKCHGHGCTNPQHEQPTSPTFLLEDDADKTAQAALPLVQAAREWAQDHAEKCRAQAYNGR